MSPVSIGILAVSMSVDAFIEALGKGAGGHRVSYRRALQTGAIFGLVEAITPLIGWAAGAAASSYVAAVDHWIAFGLLTAVGLRMVLHAFARQADEAPKEQSLWGLVATAIGTSIDAMAVGVSLAFVEANIFVIAAAIGLTTMIMSASGILAGRYLGRSFGRCAEGLGGAALMVMGAAILLQHLGVIAS